MKKTIVIYLISSTLLICCNSKENTKEESTTVNDSIITPEESLGTILFLDFRYNMSTTQYLNCVEKLILEKKLSKEGSNIYYSSNDCNILIEPLLVNNQLKQIQLKGIECIYPFYVEKYQIPPMLSKKLTQEYIENNPDYNPVSRYINSVSESIILPSAFIDKASKLNPGQRIIKENNEVTKVLPKDKFEVVRDAVTIVFEQEFAEHPIGELYFYSLTESPALLEYKRSEVGKRNMGLFGEENKLIKTNSKLRRVIKNPYVLTTIIYKLQIDAEAEKVSKENDNRRRMNEQKENKQRDSNIKNEI